MSSNNLEMISKHFTVESSNENDPQGTISINNPFFTESFCFEKFAHFNESPLYSSASANDSSFPPFNGEDFERLGGRKRKRENERDEEKPKEVVHVRAKRGQATDSHSLAERVRREKINQRLRFLQDLVPGCYKTMGMAVMLDVIINYIQSLQNQIEFLSMKLSVASRYYDFNNSTETDGIEIIQLRKFHRQQKGCGDMQEMGIVYLENKLKGMEGYITTTPTSPPLTPIQSQLSFCSFQT